MLVDRDSALDALRNVKAPALLVSGKEDPILPAPHSRRMVEKLPNARHVEMAGAAHLVPLEAPEASTSSSLTSLPICRAKFRFGPSLKKGTSCNITQLRVNIGGRVLQKLGAD